MKLILVSGKPEHNYSPLVIEVYKGQVINIILTNIYIMASPIRLWMHGVYVCMCVYRCVCMCTLYLYYKFIFGVLSWLSIILYLIILTWFLHCFIHSNLLIILISTMASPLFSVLFPISTSVVCSHFNFSKISLQIFLESHYHFD